MTSVWCFFFFKQKTAYEILAWLEFRRVLFRSVFFLDSSVPLSWLYVPRIVILKCCSTETSFCLRHFLLKLICIKKRINYSVQTNFILHRKVLSSSASHGGILFHFLRPKLFFCLKYAIFCVNENPATLREIHFDLQMNFFFSIYKKLSSADS